MKIGSFAAFLTVGLVLVISTPVAAVPILPYSEDGPQDPLILQPGAWHELGDAFPLEELIISGHTDTTYRPCPVEPDDPFIPNIEVTMTNLTSVTWSNVHYVADPETLLTNNDGWIGNAGLLDATLAFRIDSVGINVPLISESIVADNKFQPSETWVFVIQDFFNLLGGPPTPFDSVGIASLSAGWPPSTGSIIAMVPFPPAVLAGLGLLAGLGGLRIKRRR